MHKNKNKKVINNSLECLITHPSVLRAIIDYSIIALKGTGRIIVGDAPMQGCNLEKLLEISGYNEMFKFYNDNSVNIKPVDFRKYATVVDKNNILIKKVFNENEFLTVELGDKSKFYSSERNNKRYKVSDYNECVTNTFHTNDTHKYVINKNVLIADVIINVPKPKCHRLAGITGCLKNIVGITHDKACLPHRTVGSTQEGGDEYLNKSMIKKMISKTLDMKLKFEKKNYYLFALLMRYQFGVLYYLNKTRKDNALIGSWYGNDTIWRTVLDLNHILLYADKNGIMSDKPQRVEFNIADMIICGEGDGPVAPEPKHLGIIIAGKESASIDRVICEIMGFDFKKIPCVYYAAQDEALNYYFLNNCVLKSNVKSLNNKVIDKINCPKNWCFKPHNSWKGYIEK